MSTTLQLYIIIITILDAKVAPISHNDFLFFNFVLFLLHGELWNPFLFHLNSGVTWFTILTPFLRIYELIAVLSNSKLAKRECFGNKTNAWQNSFHNTLFDQCLCRKLRSKLILYHFGYCLYIALLKIDRFIFVFRMSTTYSLNKTKRP